MDKVEHVLPEIETSSKNLEILDSLQTSENKILSKHKSNETCSNRNAGKTYAQLDSVTEEFWSNRNAGKTSTQLDSVTEEFCSNRNAGKTSTQLDSVTEEFWSNRNAGKTSTQLDSVTKESRIECQEEIVIKHSAHIEPDVKHLVTDNSETKCLTNQDQQKSLFSEKLVNGLTNINHLFSCEVDDITDEHCVSFGSFYLLC
ncbi:hypothetical protein WDU94_002514 [Cyamophila willieti]